MPIRRPIDLWWSNIVASDAFSRTSRSAIRSSMSLISLRISSTEYLHRNAFRCRPAANGGDRAIGREKFHKIRNRYRAATCNLIRAKSASAQYSSLPSRIAPRFRPRRHPTGRPVFWAVKPKLPPDLARDQRVPAVVGCGPHYGNLTAYAPMGYLPQGGTEVRETQMGSPESDWAKRVFGPVRVNPI
jgi:hypothetical protein